MIDCLVPLASRVENPVHRPDQPLHGFELPKHLVLAAVIQRAYGRAGQHDRGIVVVARSRLCIIRFYALDVVDLCAVPL